jgi:hypothetical protein
MKGKRFQYRKYNVLFESVQVRGSIFLFAFKHLNGNPLSIEKDLTQVEMFLNCLTEIPEDDSISEISIKDETKNETLPVITNYQPAILRENKELLTSLRNMLIDDMKMVRKDKTYIPQAKQACNTANSIINLAKLEIMMLRSE